MNNFSPISDGLVKKYKITKTEADEFISMMFDIISEGIKNDNIAEIEGFGTFKNNNGDFIFIPSTDIRHHVNAPFLHEEEYDAETEAEELKFYELGIDNWVEVSDEEPTPVKKKVLVEREPEEEVKSIVTPNTEPKTEYTKPAVSVEPAAPILNPAKPEAKDEAVIIDSPYAPHIETIAKAEPAKTVAEPTKPAEPEKEINTEDEEYDNQMSDVDYEYALEHSNDIKKYLIIAIVVLLTIGGYGVYHFLGELSSKDEKIEQLENSVNKLKTQKWSSLNTSVKNGNGNSVKIM